MTLLRDTAAAAALLVEAAERIEAVVSITEDGPDSWLVEFEKGAQCLAQLSEVPRRLVLTAIIGTVLENSQYELRQTALAYNLLWNETYGTRIAEDAEGHQLMLIQELCPDLLAHISLSEHLIRFEALRSWWSVYVRTPPKSAARENLKTDILTLLA